MESLSWFAGGNFILGGMVTNNKTLLNFGLSVADTAGAIYNMTATGLGPEFVEWEPECYSAEADCDPLKSIRLADTSYKSRPEVVETWYYAYRATRDPKYREWSWAAFEAMNKYCKTESGFSALSDVNAIDGGSKVDLQESFVFAEVLKYVYLIFAEVCATAHLRIQWKLTNYNRMICRFRCKTVEVLLRIHGCSTQRRIHSRRRAGPCSCIAAYRCG
jgi:mannosyl-oligosaccharide alpha-1,2-mannosidase